ncbi:Type I restriction modification DNA specificity domain-containing protein [Microbulbifer thermotolerans]|uniref:restriction endonuclease subunit S n=1 Tax=Microbulbifer thermotolerans TaxID=252514 RepID=UPI0008DF6571|nr:restriction endonuclease subunit S [Microbulbifer thermotolerans]MCX2793851.1 restriction endonuclease subunit S [Microbulbifer thermotolerans]SFB70934.1 Type I restriction modification DNA specificity domain-containing protein [Microbulbifer thermotolerans]
MGNGYVIQLRDVDGDAQINWQTLVCADVSGRKQPDWLKKGNIIFSARGSRNFASLVPDTDLPVVCSPHFFIIDLKGREDVLPEFLAWQLNQAPLQKYFQQAAEGSVHVSIRKAVLGQAPIAIPPIDKQKIIVELADRVLKEKKALEKLIELRRLEVDAIAKNILK